MTTKLRFEHILSYFDRGKAEGNSKATQIIFEAQSELNFDSPFQLLIAVMLSAQCTDKRVNLVTPALFAAYPTPEALSKATKEEVLTYIHSVSYPNSKAEHLIAMSKRLVEVYGGHWRLFSEANSWL